MSVNLSKLLQRSAVVALGLVLAGCTALPHPAPSAVRYDLGPAPGLDAAIQNLPPLAIAPVQVPFSADSSTAVHYRLAYDDAQVLHAYSQARWSSPPASLVQQRLKEHLGQGGRVVLSADAGDLPPQVHGRQVPVLRLMLEEFTQIFSSAQDSVGRVRVRATLVEPSMQGDTLLAQQVFVAQPVAAAANSEAGVRALAQGVDQVGAQLVQWLQTVVPKPAQ